MPVVRVGAAIVFDTRDFPPALVVEVKRALTFQNPDWRPGRKTEPQYVYEFREHGAFLSVPRGAVATLQAAMKRHGCSDAQWESSGVVGRAAASYDPAVLVPRLRPYQIEAARLALQRVQGLVVIPTGGGKTFTMTAAALATGEAVLVCVHTEDIARQWAETFTALGGRAPRLVQGAASNFRPLAPGEVAIAMLPTLAANLTRSQPLLQSAGCVVVDECHHLPASTWRAVIACCPARYRWGCTATEVREDGWGFVIPLLIGPRIFQITERELIRLGHLNRPRFAPVESGWSPGPLNYFAHVVCPLCDGAAKVSNRKLQAGEARCTRILGRGLQRRECGHVFSPKIDYSLGKLNFGDAQTEAAAAATTTRTVLTLAEAAVDTGRQVLVLAPRKDAVAEWSEALRARGIAAAGVTGEMPKRDRENTIERVRSGEYRVLVATTLADEGLDIPALDTAINVMSGKAEGRSRQRIGRIIRPRGMDPIGFEVVHGGEEFIKQWKRRESGYIAAFGSCILSHRPLVLRDALALLAPPGRAAAAGF